MRVKYSICALPQSFIYFPSSASIEIIGINIPEDQIIRVRLLQVLRCRDRIKSLIRKKIATELDQLLCGLF